MNQQRSSAIFVFIIFLSILILVGLGWANYRFSAYGIGGDGFFVQWIGIRSLVTGGISPYNDLVTTRIQESVKNTQGFADGNHPRYTSPLYSGIVILPFALIGDKTLAHAVWLTTQQVAIFSILLIGMRLMGWRPAWYVFLIFSLFIIFSYHVIIPLLDGGLSIWVSLFIVLSILAIRTNRYEIAGVLLALSAIQPQMVILIMIFTLIWAFTHRKYILILWFFGTVIFLSIIGVFLAPDWILQYLRLLFNFSANFPPGSPGILFTDLWPGLGKQISWVLSGLLGVILLIEWWLSMRKDFHWFLWTFCLTIVISQWIGIPTIPGNFTALILPFILVSAMLSERWPRGGQWVAVLISMLLFLWEWALFITDLSSPQPQMQLNLIFPLPLIIFIGLYWVRWWAIKPRRLLIEEIRLGEAN